MINMDVSGTWAFQLDPRDTGIAEQWYNRTLVQQIKLPGSLQAQGYGEDISIMTPWTGDIFDRSWFTDPKYAPYRQPGNIKVAFWLQPEKHYVGAAWYQRDVDIPAEWAGRRITLYLERPHWGTQLWLADREIGTNNALSVPHVYDLGTGLTPGRHRLTIRVDNTMIVEVGVNAHSVSDHTQTNWNGIIGRIELVAGNPVWIDDVQIYPDVARKMVTAKVRIGNVFGRSGKGKLTLQARLYNASSQHEPQVLPMDVEITSEGATAEVQYPLGDEAQLWDEFNPSR